MRLFLSLPIVGADLSSFIASPSSIKEFLDVNPWKKFLGKSRRATAWLSGIFVPYEMRSRSIGSLLMKEWLKILRENDVAYALLQVIPETEEERELAVRFYKRFGFRQITRFKGQYIHVQYMILSLK